MPSLSRFYKKPDQSLPLPLPLPCCLSRHPRFSPLFFLLLLFLLLPLLTGCEKNKLPEKTKDLDFTVVAGTDIPPELQELIDDRCNDAFELTYSDGSCLYIVKGYGTQQTDGYNIAITDFYESKDGLVFATELTGPKKSEDTSQTETYPYIVIKTELIDASVIFS